MARTMYNKLVRDRIPDIITASGRICLATPTDADEFVSLLLDKLVEEALEVHSSNPTSLLTELADLQEVIDSILRVHGLNVDNLRAEQILRRTDRGGFRKRLKLIWTE